MTTTEDALRAIGEVEDGLLREATLFRTIEAGGGGRIDPSFAASTAKTLTSAADALKRIRAGLERRP